MRFPTKRRPPAARSFVASAVLLACLLHGVAPCQPAAAAPEKEQAALAVLRSDAPESEKAVACKQLAVHGTAAAVPDLAKLLDNERLASWARIPLESIPDPACDAALRGAAGRVTGKLLVGVLNSLGVRRDAGSVDLLVTKLGDGDPAVCTAAAAALGHIGTAAAATPLRTSLASASSTVRAAAAEGGVLCAEHLLAAGQTAAATDLYDAVRRADVPRPRIVEATRGAILARGEQGIPLLVEQLRSPDRELFRIAMSTARELRSSGVDPALAAELPRASADRAAVILEALADRGGRTAVPVMLEAAAAGPKAVRLAAIRAVGRLGDASCVDRLLATAVDSDPQVADSSKAALVALVGDRQAIDEAIRRRLPTAQGPTLPLLLEVVGRRRIAAVPEVAAVVDRDDAAVRAAALACLGEIVDLDRLDLILKPAVSPRSPADAEAAAKAVRSASVRMPDREACADRLVAAMQAAPVDRRIVLIEILGQVGGTRALAALAAAAKSDDATLQDASTRLLGNWMTADAAGPLLELAKTMPPGKFQSRAFRGYLRILRQFTPSDAERTQMGLLAYGAARDADERKAVLDAIRRTPTMEMLKLAVDAAATPELRQDARLAAATIVSKMGNASPEAWRLAGSMGLPRVQLEILRATYGAGEIQKDVTTPLRKVVGNVPVVPLPAGTYNASFGGDPAPGKQKKLTIQYKLDGKTGEASFEEDAVIEIPAPGGSVSIKPAA